MFKTDLEIAQECTLEHIRDVAAKIGVEESDLEYYGNYKAKVSLDLLNRNQDKADGKLILVKINDNGWIGRCLKPYWKKDDDCFT